MVSGNVNIVDLRWDYLEPPLILIPQVIIKLQGVPEPPSPLPSISSILPPDHIGSCSAIE
mgnify:CR=1 FL=1